MVILDISSRIEEAKKQRKALKDQKNESENKVKKGEGILSGFGEYRKNTASAISDFEDKLNSIFVQQLKTQFLIWMM